MLQEPLWYWKCQSIDPRWDQVVCWRNVKSAKKRENIYIIIMHFLLDEVPLTLLGGCIRFLLAWAGDRKRLFFEPVYSLKLGVWSANRKGFMTSDKKFCLEKAIWILPFVPTGMLFRCWTQRSTATESPICTMAVPSLVLRNLICNKKIKEKMVLVEKWNTWFQFPGNLGRCFLAIQVECINY